MKPNSQIQLSCGLTCRMKYPPTPIIRATTNNPNSTEFKSTDHGNCNADWWKDAFSNEFVLTREDFKKLKADFVGIQNIPAAAPEGDEKAGAVYDLSGRKVGNGRMTGGIRIRNGRKYYVK